MIEREHTNEEHSFLLLSNDLNQEISSDVVDVGNQDSGVVWDVILGVDKLWNLLAPVIPLASIIDKELEYSVA